MSQHTDVIQLKQKLSTWAQEAKNNRTFAIAEIFIFGSIVNYQGGELFDRELSDVDIIISLSDALAPFETIKGLVGITRALTQLDTELREVFKRENNAPIVSVTVVHNFELKEGIHRSRNTKNPYDVPIFCPLPLTNDVKLIPIGGRLADDLLDHSFAAWTVLAEAQAYRSDFVTPKTLGTEGNQPDYANLSKDTKDLFRNAYNLRCLSEKRNPDMLHEDDLIQGRQFLLKLVESCDIRNYHSYSSELENLKLLLGGKRQITSQEVKVNHETILFCWELLVTAAYELIAMIRAKSSGPGLRNASSAVLFELMRLARTTLKSVDTAIVLYESPELVDDDNNVLVEKKLAESPPAYAFGRYDKNNLYKLAAEWPDDIKRYLSEKAEEKVEGEKFDAQCKVGFAGLAYSQVGLNERPFLKIVPLSYWVTNEFNKGIAVRQTDEKLQGLRNKYAAELLSAGDDHPCRCPSHLYLEVAVVSEDNHILTLEKAGSHSALAVNAGHLIKTCGIEYGFVWDRHVSVNRDGSPVLLIGEAISDGLKDELGLSRSDVETIKIKSIAIQHLHLNASIVGYIILNKTRWELSQYWDDLLKQWRNGQTKNIGMFRYFQIGAALEDHLRWIRRQDVASIIEQEKNKKLWHQTGLLRLYYLNEDI